MAKIIGGLLVAKPGAIHFRVMAGGIGPSREVGEEYELEPDKRELCDWCHGHYTVELGNDPDRDVIARFKLYQLPHCCGILVSCNAEVSPAYRHRRVGTALNTMRQDI